MRDARRARARRLLSVGFREIRGSGRCRAEFSLARAMRPRLAPPSSRNHHRLVNSRASRDYCHEYARYHPRVGQRGRGRRWRGGWRGGTGAGPGRGARRGRPAVSLCARDPDDNLPEWMVYLEE